MSQSHEDMQQELRDIRKLLYGDPSTGKGGLAHSVVTLADTLYGTDRNPGGIVSDMANLKRFMYVLAGAVTFAQFAIQILFHFWHP